jgi:putative DNA primase/helicase
MNITAPIKPDTILANCTLLNPLDETYLNHPIIQRFGSPAQPIYVDQYDVDINGVSYDNPLILPIYDGQLNLVQCAVLQDKQQVQVIPHGLSKGFALYGRFDHAEPIIITYNLEAFFKIAQTGYAVALVILPTLCDAQRTELKPFDFDQMAFVIQQLSKAGYTQLYMPVRPEHIKLDGFQKLEHDTALRLLNQHIVIDEQGIKNDYLIELYKNDDVEDVKTFLQLVIEQLPANKLLPKGHLAKPFRMDDGAFLHILDTGLYLIKEKRDEDGELKQTSTFICHSAIILGEARSLNNDNWKRVIQFHDKDNTLHRLLIPYEHFMGEAQEALKIIANHGLMPPRHTNKKNVFINYIQDYPIEQRFRCVERAGWHGRCFATPNKTYGSIEDEELLFHSDNKSPYTVSGSFEEWQKLSQLIEPHALAVLAFSSAFSGQLVLPLGAESGGFHLYGSSTDGKSTITKASCSIWGNPKHISKSWRTTDNALENEAELRNDSFLNLDELRQAAPKAVSDIVYMLTGGQGKARSTKAGKNRDTKQFSLMYTSTGEVTLEEHLRRGSIELDAGLLLRFAHIPSDAGKGYGVFDCINYGTAPQDIGNRINELASQHYGHAGIKWLEYLTQDKDAVMQQAQVLLDSFIEQHSQIKNGQASRVLRRFALVAAAGELATQAGITGWMKGRAFEAIAHCFNTWLGNLGHGENMEETKSLEHIKAFFEANGTSRFEDITRIRQVDGDVLRQRIHNRVGYYDPKDKVYLVSPTMFKKEMCIGMNEASVKKALIKHGWIKGFIEGDKKLYVKKSSNTLPDGTRPRMMHFSAEAMQNLDSEI